MKVGAWVFRGVGMKLLGFRMYEASQSFPGPSYLRKREHGKSFCWAAV